MNANAPKASDIPSYAEYMMKNKQGNCYRYAAASTYVARVLGYDVRMCAGRVSTIRNAPPGEEHGWCMVRIGNSWRYLDPCEQRVAPGNKKLFLVKKFPFWIRKDIVYTMNVKDGEVTWTKKKV